MRLKYDIFFFLLIFGNSFLGFDHFRMHFFKRFLLTFDNETFTVTVGVYRGVRRDEAISVGFHQANSRFKLLNFLVLPLLCLLQAKVHIFKLRQLTSQLQIIQFQLLQPHPQRLTIRLYRLTTLIIVQLLRVMTVPLLIQMLFHRARQPIIVWQLLLYFV